MQRVITGKYLSVQYIISYTPKETSNAYTFVLAFSQKLKSLIKNTLGKLRRVFPGNACPFSEKTDT